MRGKIVTIFLAAAGILLFSAGSSAHHGVYLVYDVSQKVTVAGTVTDYQFVNPHVLIFFEVTGKDGAVIAWSAALTSPSRLARNEGWSRETLTHGDKISITGSPTRDGAPSLWVQQVTVDDAPLLGSYGAEDEL